MISIVWGGKGMGVQGNKRGINEGDKKRDSEWSTEES